MGKFVAVPAPESDTIDPQQVDRISSVHRGFLYQHLYAVACLLGIGREPTARVIIERDEDVEIATSGSRFYVQVKTRNRLLQPADVADTLDRVAEIRAAHTDGRRPGRAQFAIVSNAEPGPMLEQQIKAASWPNDVALISPRSPHPILPPAWTDISSALAWCVAQARETPFAGLSPETLVWKLAALVQHAATGAHNRMFSAEEMPELMEQLVVQLQDFPEPPLQYRPQQGEPPLVADARVRLLVGFSGSGKTAWASQAALHAPGAVTYFDVGDLPAGSVGSALARELAARFLGGARAGVGGAMFAERSGSGVLRACAAALAEQTLDVTVVLDNAHRLNADALRVLIEAGPNLRFVCIAQPWSGAAHIEAQFQLQAEVLRGWAEHDVAAEFRAEGCPLSLESSQRVVRYTGGLPLYVKSAARVVRTAFSGDSEAFLKALEERTHAVETAQELILRDAFDGLSPDARRVAAVLGLADVALTRAEALTILAAAELDEPAAAAALRELRRAFGLSVYHGDRLGIHDALRPLAAEERAGLRADVLEAVLRRLHQVLVVSLAKTRDVPRLSSVLRLLPRIGESMALAELAGDEMFYEQGDPRTLRDEIERVAEDRDVAASERFWAHDALAFWDSRDGGVPARARLQEMAGLVTLGGLGAHEQMALAFKNLVLHGSTGDREALERTYADARKLPIQEEAVHEMLRYNYAVALFRLKAFNDVLRITEALISSYYKSIGLCEADVIGKSNRALLDALPQPVDPARLKRLADCLALWAMARVQLGSFPMPRRIHAAKFYALAQAARSVITTGLEAVDDFLDIMGDAEGALQVMEQLVLPALQEAHTTDLILPVRSHYAIVLAWKGRIGEARAEMRTLQTYAGSPQEQAMLTERGRAIEEIASGRAQLAPKAPPAGVGRLLPKMTQGQKGKVGRNDPCPCGSGLKYKRCHG